MREWEDKGTWGKTTRDREGGEWNLRSGIGGGGRKEWVVKKVVTPVSRLRRRMRKRRRQYAAVATLQGQDSDHTFWCD